MANISQVWHVIYRVVLVSSIISLLLIHATLQILNFILRTPPKSLTLFIFSLSIQPSSSCSTSTSQVPGKLAAKCPGVGEVLHGHDFTLRSYMSSFNGTLPILAMGDVAHMISRTGSPPFLVCIEKIRKPGDEATKLPCGLPICNRATEIASAVRCAIWCVCTAESQPSGLQFEFVCYVGMHGKVLPAWPPPFISRPLTRDHVKQKRSILCDACSFKVELSNDVTQKLTWHSLIEICISMYRRHVRVDSWDRP